MTLVKDYFQNDRFAANAGIEIIEARIGYAKTRMLITSEHLNAGGVCQGGAIFTLADLAFAVVANSHERLTLSIQSNIHFFKAESKGCLYAEAKETLDHRKLPYIEVHVTNEKDELVAVFSGIGYRKEVDLSLEY